MALPALSEVDTMAFPELPDIAQISITNSCRCMTEALVILDRIETQKTEDSSSHLGMLTINKNAVSQCTRVLECLSCQSRPGCALLLILICRNLVSQFQQLLFGDWDASTSPDNPSPAGSINSDRSASLGQYSIDTSEEQRQVLHALSIVRGRNLAIFLDRLKRFVGNQGRASHMEKVGRIEIWHRSSMERLRQLSYEQI